MRVLTKIISATAVALSLAAAAAPVQAAVFAQFTPDTGKAIYRWVNSAANNNGTGGAFYTTATPTANVAGATSVHFSFLDPSLSDLTFIPVKFRLNTTVASGHAAVFTPGASTWTQTDLNGGFSFIYTGATHTYGTTQVLHNANLLSGTFTDAWIQGNGGTGSTNLSIGNGGVFSSLTSDFYDTSDVVAGSEEFALNLLAVTPVFGAKPLKALKSFRANGGGNFSAVTMVPEPATWGLMIMGFGGVGFMVRRRRQGAAFA